MTFQPLLPLTGYSGWRYLDRTTETQKELVATSSLIKRETDHFRDRIAQIRTAGELISDRSLLKVALGAFGLEDDLPNKAFIRQVLESRPGDDQALANRLSDNRYREFAQAFGFAESAGPNTQRSGFADRIIAAYETNRFEVAVGNQDESMRLSLTADRELAKIAGGTGTADGMWYQIMGQPPLRKVFETALGLPDGFGALDLERQLTTFREKAEQAFGSGEIAQFRDPAKREELIRLYLVRSEIQQSTAAVRGTTALTLLQSLPSPKAFYGN